MEEKLYTKTVNGEVLIKNSKNIIVLKGNKCIYNPSETTLLEDGWKIYTITEDNDINDNVIEEENILTIKRNELKKKICEYDSSEEINGFLINGKKIWLDKSTRVGLKLRFESELENGLENTILWYGTESFELNLDVANKMLGQLEVYASRCYDNTQKHIATVELINTIEEIENYNYKTGYPEILSF